MDDSNLKADCGSESQHKNNAMLNAGRYEARIVRWVSAWIYSHEEEFTKAEVGSFDEALDMCKAVGSCGGLVNSDVEFISIDRRGYTAEFKVKNRMRYEGDSFSLLVTPCI